MKMKHRQSCDASGHLRRSVVGGCGIDIPSAFFQQLQIVKNTTFYTETRAEDFKHAIIIIQSLLGASGGGFKIRMADFKWLNRFAGNTINLFQKGDIKSTGVI